MRLGFTGTRDGMTDLQKEAFRVALRKFLGRPKPLAEFHHGACVGADEDAAVVVWIATTVVIVAHPPSGPKFLSAEALRVSNSAGSPAPYLERNRAIVDETDGLVACPANFTEEARSGTWATIRYARKKKKPILILWPDGTATEEGPK